MVLQRRKAKEFKNSQISQQNNNEGDSKVDFTLEKMHMKASRNNDETAVDDLLFKGNT
jgi:hypothetical protein